MALKHLVIGLALLSAPSMANAEELTGTLKKIKDTGTITIGYRDASVPFSYLGADNKPIGFAMDICLNVVEAVKKELKTPNLNTNLVAVTSANRIPLIENGTVDLECGSTTNNATRQKQVSFAVSHFLTPSKYVTKKSSNIKSIADLKGKTIVGTAGTTNIKQATEKNTAEGLGMTILTAKDHPESFLNVETGRAVAFVMDDILLATLVANSKDPSQYTISEDAFSKPEPYGVMLPKDDAPFKKVVDAAIIEQFKTGGEALYKKWFQSPIPPKDLNLNLPLTTAMKNQLANPIDSPNPDDYK